MKFTVTGRDQQTGEAIELIVEAVDAQHAAMIAARRNMVVESLGTLKSSAPIIGRTPIVHSQPPPVMPQWKLVQKRPRAWLGLLIFGAAFFALVPVVPLITGLVIVLIVAMYLILPRTRRVLGNFLRVAPAQPIRRALKLSTLACWGSVLIGIGIVSQIIAKEQQARESERQVTEAARNKKIDDAHLRVTQLLAEAKTSLQAGNVESADETLSQAEKIENATTLDQVHLLRQRIKISNDPPSILQLLATMPDDAFTGLKMVGKVPQSLEFGFPVLTERAVSLARSQLSAAIPVREERAKKAAAEIAERQRIEMAKVEARKSEAAAKAASEAAARATQQKEVQDKLNAYMKLLETAGATVVKKVAVSHDGDAWNATLTVADIWHLKHKQIRLQDAQTLWKAWAALTSPNAPEKARISIVDANGNEVGGSGILGIWVQD